VVRNFLLSAIVFTSLFSAAFAGGSIGQGSRLILATYWGDDAVALLDLEAEEGHEELWRLDTLAAAGCAKPYDIRSGIRGDEAYVSCSGSNKVAIIDVVAQQVKATIETGSSPRDLIVFHGGNRLIVANSGSDTVSVIDLDGRRKLYDVSVPGQPYGVAVGSDGGTAVVTGWANGTLNFLTLAENSGELVDTVEVGLLPYTVVLAGEPPRAFVAANGSQRVVQVDIETRAPISEIEVGRNPWSIAASNDGESLLVTNNRSASLSLLRTGAAPAANSEMSNILISAGAQEHDGGGETNRAPKNAALSLDGSEGVFTDLANNQIVKVDLETGSIIRVIDVGKAPYGIEYLRSDAQ